MGDVAKLRDHGRMRLKLNLTVRCELAMKQGQVSAVEKERSEYSSRRVTATNVGRK